MLKPIITIEQWDGGSSLSERVGKKNQNFQGSNLDFKSRKGYLTCKPGWTRMSLVTTDVDIEFNAILFTAEDNNLYFGSENTVIYKQATTGTITYEHGSSQSGGIRSLLEYKGYMYYPQNTTIGRSDLAGSPAYTDNWQTGLNNVTDKPSIESADGNAYFGNGQYVASWDGTTFNATALDLQLGWSVRALANFGIPYLAIAINNLATGGVFSKCKILLWDRVAPSWNDEIVVPEISVQAILFAKGYLWIWAGPTCNLYVCPLGSRVATRVYEFFNQNTANNIFSVFPNAVQFNQGRVSFGLSGVDSISSPFNPSGIYSFNPDPQNLQMNIEHRGGSSVDYRALGISYFNLTPMLYAGYESGSSQRLIRESTYSGDTPYQSSEGSSLYAYYESFYYDAPPGKKLQIDGIGIDFLPTANCQFTLSYKKDEETNFTDILSGQTTAGVTGKYKQKNIEAFTIKVKLSFNGGGTTDRPFFKRIFLTGKLIDDSRGVTQ